MIKLIATDMDGTLLDNDGKLPKDFFSTFQKLKDNNIKFVVASGRSYPTLYENFKPISDELFFICDNGSCIVENNKPPKVSIIDREIVDSIISTCDSIPNVEVILCGTKGAYHKPCSKEHLNEIDKYYIKKFVVNDFSSVNDDIFKVALCDINDSSINCYPIINSLFSLTHKVVVSGKMWVDITNKNIDKGSALEKIQIDENISKNETMAFGDFYNDIEMLQRAYYSFVMENANEDMKQYGNFIAKSNTENGVITAIEEYALS